MRFPAQRQRLSVDGQRLLVESRDRVSRTIMMHRLFHYRHIGPFVWRSTNHSVACCLVACCLVMLGCDSSSTPMDPPGESTEIENLLRNAAYAKQRGDRAGAKRWINRAIASYPDDPTAWGLGGKLLESEGKLSKAADFYQASLERTTDPPTSQFDHLARLWMRMGYPFRVIPTLQAAITNHPDDLKLRADCGGLMMSLGLKHAAAVHLQKIVRSSQTGVDELMVLVDLTQSQIDQEICDYALAHGTDDLRPRYTLARRMIDEDNWRGAAVELKPVVQRHPQFREAGAFYCRTLVELEDSKTLDAWVSRMTPEIRRHPQFWIAAGIHNQRIGNHQAAANSFRIAVQQNPNHGEALTRLSSELAQLGENREAQRFADRANQIQTLQDAFDSLVTWRSHSQRAAIEIAMAMHELGRHWEAAGWARLAPEMTQDPAPDLLGRLRAINLAPASDSPWQTPLLELASPDDTAAWSFEHLFAPASASRNSTPEIAPLGLMLVDEAPQRGLNHVCRIATDESSESGLMIYQSNAGGASVIDYDLDGWPDVYLTHCDGEPLQQDSTANPLFRNRNGIFQDVTLQASAGDTGFTQGVTTSDVNADGFPDLYVGAFGENQLYLNSGDGTFQRATESWGISGKQWTTSIAAADLNGDSLTDLIDTNYVAGTDVLSRRCQPEGESRPRSCSPKAFPAELDRVRWGNASGHSARSTILGEADGMTAGHALGVIVGQLDGEDGLDIYAANDMSANHFWSGVPSSDSPDSHRFVEQAAFRGLAVNGRSRAQASMGIAAGDADGDGDTDLYLTHFTNEYNTLYLQQSPGIWTDQTQSRGLVEPTQSLLGYGTQWVDLDNDGSPELIVANGNVDDFSDADLPLRMPAQLFRRDSGGRFLSIGDSSISEYFSVPKVGRALVRSDFNRDGRIDALVTHLFDPVSLLINRADRPSPSPHHNRFAIELVGNASDRNAIGTQIEIQVGNTRSTGQLFSGDGYHCANETTIWFGMAAAPTVDQISVTWPDGTRQSASNLSTDSTFLWVQGQPIWKHASPSNDAIPANITEPR